MNCRLAKLFRFFLDGLVFSIQGVVLLEVMRISLTGMQVMWIVNLRGIFLIY